MQNSLIVILGPTGVGKTDTSVIIAERFGSEIISCDSRQFYREMSIGTSVPSQLQLERIKHHFIRFLPVNEYYSASLFERDVLKILPSLFEKNSVVIMTGGSGLYIDAVCGRFDDIPDIDPETREKYIRKYQEEGIESLRAELKHVDPDHYKKVDLKNPKRIIRALEIHASTGFPYSSFLNKKRTSPGFNIIKIGLNRPRQELYDRIDSRVDEMISCGLEEEARSLFHLRSLNALNTVGYKELFEFFDGKISREKSIELIKRDTRRFAKRQMTWWSKDTSITWFKPDEIEEITGFITRQTTLPGRHAGIK